VERAAARLERQRDLLRRAALRAFEHHVLEQVRNAHLGAGLVGAGAPHPDPHCHRADARHPLGQHHNPARRGGLGDLPVEPDGLHQCERAGAASAFSSSALRERRIRPRSSTSRPRMVLPSWPIRSPILSGRIWIVMMRGAYLDSSERGFGMTWSMMSRMCSRACFAFSSAWLTMLKSRPSILMSIWIELTPWRVPATLKSMSPR